MNQISKKVIGHILKMYMMPQKEQMQLVLTEWEEYSNLDWKFISKIMRQPAWIFDSRYILNVEEIKKVGLNLWRIGDGANNLI